MLLLSQTLSFTTLLFRGGYYLMIQSTKLDLATRNIYVRYLLNLLVDKYHITQASVAENVGFYQSYVRDFNRGQKNMRTDNLNALEEYLTDLYGGILEEEIPQTEDDFKYFIEKLKQ